MSKWELYKCTGYCYYINEEITIKATYRRIIRDGINEAVKLGFTCSYVHNCGYPKHNCNLYQKMPEGITEEMGTKFTIK